MTSSGLRADNRPEAVTPSGLLPSVFPHIMSLCCDLQEKCNSTHHLQLLGAVILMIEQSSWDFSEKKMPYNK